MEKQVYEALSKKERVQLAELYESELMKPIKHALEVYQTEKAHHVLVNSPNHENTLLNRGMVEGARFIFDLSKRAFKEENKRRTTSNA